MFLRITILGETFPFIFSNYTVEWKMIILNKVTEIYDKYVITYIFCLYDKFDWACFCTL
jgi:hypothetical protein